jgi:hypothetical protein
VDRTKAPPGEQHAVVRPLECILDLVAHQLHQVTDLAVEARLRIDV